MNNSSRNLTRERGYNAKSNTSVTRLRRSVSGMTSLMPLKLSSPSLPELASRPTSSTSPNRQERFSREYGNFEISEWLKQHHQHKDHQSPLPRSPKHRDTPVYTSQGSPLISSPYYADNAGLFPCSPPDSCSEELEIANDPGIQDDDTYWNDSDAHESRDQEGSCDGDDCSVAIATPKIGGPDRTSDMSFHCMGEALYFDEAAWLSSSLEAWNSLKKDRSLHVLSQDMPRVEGIETWLSDISSFSDAEDNLLACATALAPAKPNLVDVNLNRFSGVTVKIPPRTSSLVITSPNLCLPDDDHGSWMTFGNHLMASQHKLLEYGYATPVRLPLQRRRRRPSFPTPRPDLAMPSPPQSPTSWYIDQSTITMPLVDVQIQHNRRQDTDFDPAPREAAGSSTQAIISVIDEYTSNFPSRMLLPDAPCVSEVRALLHRPMLPSRRRLQSGDEDPKSPLACPTDFPSSRNIKHRRPPRHRRHSFFISNTHSSIEDPQHSFDPRKLDNEFALAPPDLEPSRRVFPDTSNFMRSTLYAHVLVYTFISSLNDSTSPSPIGHEIHHHRAESHVPTEGGSLGISSIDTLSTLDAREIEENLRNCIGILVAEMEGHHDAEGFYEIKSRCINESLLRTLVEVVKSCEMQ